MLSVNVLLLTLLLLILLHALLHVLLLHPPLRIPTFTCTIATTETKRSVAVLLGSGKLDLRQKLHALPAAGSNLVFLLDSLSRCKFLVDTRRASVSVFPQSKPTASAPASSVRLLTTGGTPLPCFGTHSILLQFGSRRFSWSFQLATFSVPILGSDFLRQHSFLVDVARAPVFDADSLEVLSTVSSPSPLDTFCAHLQTAPREISKLLSEYPDVLSLDGFSASTLKHGVFRNFPMVPGSPVFVKACFLDPD